MHKSQVRECLADIIKIGDRLRLIQQLVKSKNVRDGDKTRRIIELVEKDQKMPFTIEIKYKRSSSNEERKSIRIIPKEERKICENLSFDAKGNFTNCLNSWALVKSFHSGKRGFNDTVGAIIYDPSSGDLFYGYEKSAFYANTNFPRIEPRKLIAPEKLDFPAKAMIGNWHRNGKAIPKAAFQDKLYQIGQLSLCDSGGSDIALANLAAGGFGLVFLAGLEESLRDCKAGLYIAQQAGYATTIDIVSYRGYIPGMKSGCAIAAHPSIQERAVNAYRETVKQFPNIIRASSLCRPEGARSK